MYKDISIDSNRTLEQYLNNPKMGGCTSLLFALWAGYTDKDIDDAIAQGKVKLMTKADLYDQPAYFRSVQSVRASDTGMTDVNIHWIEYTGGE